jgi:light-regulated signal transduction histidine kinase (bacteriophytochrome)
MEEATASARAEIERLTAELRRSNERFTHVLRAASHDFAEPLQIVLSYAELLAARHGDELDETSQRFLDGIETGAKRIRALVDGLTAIGGLLRRDVQLTRVDCAEIVEDVLDALADRIDETDATVLIDPLPTVTADRMQLGRLFENLIDNAIKFRSSALRPEVRVSAERRPGELVLSVRDNGIGVDFSRRDRIFGMFERLHPRSVYPGVGIGLTVCKEIVERLGGRIWVESGPGPGSDFKFTIPDEPGR